MSRASWLTGEAAPRPRRPAPVTVASEPGPPPLAAEVVTPRPAPKPALPPDLASRLAQAFELLDAPPDPPVPYAGAGAHRRANKLGHALEQARAAVRRALELAR